MNIPELKDFFDRGEVKALSKDRIKIGCAEYDRKVVEIERRGHPSEGYVFYRGSGYPETRSVYWITPDDLDRMLKMMDEFDECKPKFAIGDYACLKSETPCWETAFRITSIERDKYGFAYGPYGYREDRLVRVHKPAPVPIPFSGLQWAVVRGNALSAPASVYRAVLDLHDMVQKLQQEVYDLQKK